MGLQDGQLGMVGLGVVGDVPPNSLQPPLPDGIHLRWASAPERALPWYGYYLFRREHRPGKPICFSQGLAGMSTGQVGSTQLTTAMGIAASDRPLVLSDAFAPSGVVELDLSGRGFVEVLLGSASWARHAEVKVGVPDKTKPGRTCVDFRRGIKSGSNPRTLHGATFLVLGGRETVGASLGPRLLRAAGTVVREWATTQGRVEALDCGLGLEIELPCAATEVDLLTSHDATPLEVDALDEHGRVVARATAHQHARVLELIKLRGRGITRVLVRCKQDRVALHEICWVCAVKRGAIHVDAYDDSTRLARQTVSVQPGQVQVLAFDFDRITRIRVGGGDGALVDVCVVPITQDARGGWASVPNFTAPLTLPVMHPDYPARQGAVNEPADETLALARVQYGPASAWSGTPFSDLHDELEQLVVGGPGSTPMAQRTAAVTATGAGGGTAPTLNESPYGLVMLASLNPAVAQMLGLYWNDDTADPAKTYDYLIVADDEGAGQLSESVVLGLVRQGDWSQLDGHVVYGLRRAASPPLAAPSAKSYALPGTTIADASGALQDWSGNAGLTWDTPVIGQNALAPGSPVLYHVWRAGLGDADQPAAPSGYTPITSGAPVLVSRPGQAAPAPQSPSDWPAFALQYIDSGLADGWYGYEVSGIDIFGRHSANGGPAPWHQWTPEPDPVPWYYVQPAADRVIHQSAVRLKDLVPPPPPPGVEAWALDPADPFLTQDAAYQSWYATLSTAEQSLIGVRVKWTWPYASQRQAPDTAEFRIYVNPGRFNALLGNVTAVAAAGAGTTRVTTDIANAQAVGAYAGTYLQMGPRSFRIMNSDAGTPLVLEVQDTTSPTSPSPATGPCSVSIPPNHSLAVDVGDPVSYAARRYVVDYAAKVTVTQDANGNPLRTYEILLPVPGDADRSGAPVSPSIADPMAYGAVGVTAADDKTYVPDNTHWSGTDWGNRDGNESRVGGPATIFAVFRGPVPTPVVPADSDAVFASRADYHSHSFYTYRWPPLAHVKLLVYRAMDDAILTAYWALSPKPTVDATDDTRFPDATSEPRWDQTLRESVAVELQDLRGKADIEAARALFRDRLSHDALRVLAGLHELAPAYSQITIQALDPDDPANADRPGPDTAPGYTPDPALRAYIDTLDGRSSNRWFYRSAYVDHAHNVSALSLSSPPVYLYDVVPPRAPVVTRVLAGERAVMIDWAPNREPDLAEYRILRATDLQSAADPRTMTLVHTEAVADVTAQPSEYTWTDSPVRGLTTLYYRLLTVDTIGNVSDPSPVALGRAHDEALPAVPALTLGWSAVAAPADAVVSWTAPDDETMLELRPAGQPLWQAMGAWQAAGSPARTLQLDATLTWQFRLQVRKYTGAVAVGAPQTLQGIA